MINYSQQNKKAWEYNAYEFWITHNGTPEESAKKALENPKKFLKRHAAYFDGYENITIANICGSCGKKAIPMVILGANVTIFDISEDNRRYALETSAAAQIPLNYEVCDILQIDLDKYAHTFDVVFMEGGVLHYFHDLNEFMRIMRALLKPAGRLICSDFHPFTKIVDALNLQTPTMSYFSTNVYEGEMAHARFFPPEIREQMPKCLYRKYTLSEIINAVLANGFKLLRFDEHPAWENLNLPGEFTLVATKEESDKSNQARFSSP